MVAKNILTITAIILGALLLFMTGASRAQPEDYFFQRLNAIKSACDNGKLDPETEASLENFQKIMQDVNATLARLVPKLTETLYLNCLCPHLERTGGYQKIDCTELLGLASSYKFENKGCNANCQKLCLRSKKDNIKLRVQVCEMRGLEEAPEFEGMKCIGKIEVFTEGASKLALIRDGYCVIKEFAGTYATELLKELAKIFKMKNADIEKLLETSGQ